MATGLSMEHLVTLIQRKDRVPRKEEEMLLVIERESGDFLEAVSFGGGWNHGQEWYRLKCIVLGMSPLTYILCWRVNGRFLVLDIT